MIDVNFLINLLYIFILVIMVVLIFKFLRSLKKRIIKPSPQKIKIKKQN